MLCDMLLQARAVYARIIAQHALIDELEGTAEGRASVLGGDADGRSELHREHASLKALYAEAYALVSPVA